MFDQLLKYDLGKGVEAFSTQRDAVLPYEVTQGHQVHCSRVAIIDRAGIPPESLHVCGIDSYTTEAYFSARGEGVQCGRIINAIKLI